MAVSLFVAVTWCVLYERVSLESWKSPAIYTSASGDMWFYLAWAKAYEDGGINLFGTQKVPHLGAPYVANWNDFPLTEKIIPAVIGWTGRFIGLFPAGNLFCMMAHVLAAASFWFVAWRIGMNRVLGASLSIVFGLSHYNLLRFEVGHLDLLCNFHMPLIILVSWWMLSRRNYFAQKGNVAGALAVSVVSGILSPYYCAVHLMFCGFGVLRQALLRRWRTMFLCVALMVVASLRWLAINLNSFAHWVSVGQNPAATHRDYKSLELFSLSVPALFLCMDRHRYPAFAKWSGRVFLNRALIVGESQFQYIGIVGVLCLAGLLLHSLLLLLRDKAQLIPVHFWQTLWLFVFSKAGVLVLGLAGFKLLRGTNRFSMVILALALLFMGKFLSRRLGRIPAALCGLAAICIALWDQTPPRMPNSVRTAEDRMAASDADFAHSLEEALPAGAMLFQLPVMDCPEPASKINAMVAYEHFRPFLHSSKLRYSFGSDKGRPEVTWQKRAEELPAPELFALLEKLGFSAVIVDRRGYQDGGNALLANFRRLGAKTVSESPLGDFCALRLPQRTAAPSTATPPHQAENPQTAPSPTVEFKSGWSYDEKGTRWAVSTNPVLELRNNEDAECEVAVSFEFFTLAKGTVKAWWSGGALGTWTLASLKPASSDFILLRLPRGSSDIHFAFSEPLSRPANGDHRLISFQLKRVVVEKVGERIWDPVGEVVLAAPDASGATLLGFSEPENAEGRWTVAPSARITLPFPLPRKVRMSFLNCRAYGANIDVPAVVTIGGVSHPLFLGVESTAPTLEFEEVAGCSSVEFDIQAPTRPYDLCVNKDPRPLGIFFSSIEVRGADQPPQDGIPGAFAFKEGWSHDEGGDRWSTSIQAAGTVVPPHTMHKAEVSLEFSAKTLTRRNLQLYHKGKLLAEQALIPGAWNRLSTSFPVDFQTGEGGLQFVTDQPPMAPMGGADPRTLSFFIRKPVIRIHPLRRLKAANEP